MTDDNTTTIVGHIGGTRPAERLEDRLAQLARLHVEGHLDDVEFTAAKATSSRGS